MRTSSKTLALRDPAAAILLGSVMMASPNQPAAAFGDDYGDDAGDDYGDDYGDEYGGFDFGDEYGGYDFGAAPAPAAAVRRHARRVPPAAAMKAWHAMKKQSANTSRRARLIEPNHGSRIKIERYAFAVNAALILGAAGAINATGQPDTNIRPQRVTMNAPAPGFITVTEIKVANVSTTVGGVQDAFDYNALGVGQSLDMPTLTPANRATVLGNYTGFVPPGFVGGQAFTFAASFKGPASIIA